MSEPAYYAAKTNAKCQHCGEKVGFLTFSKSGGKGPCEHVVLVGSYDFMKAVFMDGGEFEIEGLVEYDMQKYGRPIVEAEWLFKKKNFETVVGAKHGD